MERLGEEEEEEDIEEIEDEEPFVDVAVRERELATQKARIVSQMAGVPMRGPERASPRRLALSAATTIPRAVPSYEGRNHDSNPPVFKPKMSLFDIYAQNLSNAMAMAATPTGFRAPREFIVRFPDLQLTDHRYPIQSSSTTSFCGVLARLLWQIWYGLCDERRHHQRTLQ